MAAFEDTFTVSVDTNLVDHTPDIGTAWTLVSGDAGAIVAMEDDNSLSTSVDTKTLVTSDNLGSADCWVEGILSSANVFQSQPNKFLALRIQDADNFIGWILAGTGGAGLRLVRVLNGSTTNLITTQGATGVVYRIEAEGSTLRFYGDGVQIGSDVTETTFQAETKQGVITSSSLSFQRWLNYYAADVIGGTGGGEVTVNSLAQPFTESISATVTAAQVTETSISSTAQAFTESNVINVSANITSSISATALAFTASISATVTAPGVNDSSINSFAQAFTESNNVTVFSNLSANIQSQAQAFTESINAVRLIGIDTSISAAAPAFIESLLIQTPTLWTDRAQPINNWQDQTQPSNNWQDRG